MHDVMSLLPPPRVPSRPKWPSADAIAALVDEDAAAPIRRADEAQRAAARAVDDLERHRPGQMGTKWREAIDADAAEHAAGRTPERWAAARLLEEDPQRWAYARVLAGAVARAWRRADKELDKPRIAAAARAAEAEVAERFERVAAAAWQAHDNPHAAWPLVGEGERLMAEHTAVRGILAWLAGESTTPTRSLVYDASRLPGGPVAAGHWLATDLALNPQKKLMGVPKGSVWPAGAERLIGQAMPVGGGLSALMTKGVHETVGVE